MHINTYLTSFRGLNPKLLSLQMAQFVEKYKENKCINDARSFLKKGSLHFSLPSVARPIITREPEHYETDTFYFMALLRNMVWEC